jgi:hypothetical protein
LVWFFSRYNRVIVYRLFLCCCVFQDKQLASAHKHLRFSFLCAFAQQMPRKLDEEIKR